MRRCHFSTVCLCACCTSKCVHYKKKKKKKKKRAAWRCCDTVPMFVSLCVCVCVVFSLFLCMCGISLQRSQGLMGTCTNSSMQPLRAATPTLSSPVCILRLNGCNSNWDAGQAEQTRLCCSRDDACYSAFTENRPVGNF